MITPLRQDRRGRGQLALACVALLLVVGTACKRDGHKEPTLMYDGERRRATEVTVVIPSAYYMGRSVSTSSVTLLGMGTIETRRQDPEPRIYFVAVDGRQVPGDGAAPIELLPGKHLLSYRMVGPGTHVEADLPIDLEVCRVYSTTAILAQGAWTFNLHRYGPLTDYQFLRQPDP